MKLITRMTLKPLLPLSLGFVVIGAFLFILVDFFANLSRYINSEITPLQILQLMVLYFPRSVSYALPLGMMLGTTITLATMYTNREMLVLNTARVPLIRFLIPLIIFALLVCVLSVVLDNFLVVNTLRKRAVLNKEYFGTSQLEESQIPAIISQQGEVIYISRYYDAAAVTHYRLTVIIKESEEQLWQRIDAESGEWNEEIQQWQLYKVHIFTRQKNDAILARELAEYTQPWLNEPPSSFSRPATKVDDLTLIEAYNYIQYLKKSGLPYQKVAVNFYERLSFSLTPLIVVLLASALCGFFKKSTLLMSLLAGTCLSVIFYVIRLLIGLFAINGAIDPLIGGISGTALFFLGSLLLLFFTPT